LQYIKPCLQMIQELTPTSLRSLTVHECCQSLLLCQRHDFQAGVCKHVRLFCICPVYAYLLFSHSSFDGTTVGRRATSFVPDFVELALICGDICCVDICCVDICCVDICCVEICCVEVVLPAGGNEVIEISAALFNVWNLSVPEKPFFGSPCPCPFGEGKPSAAYLL
jgi:hypothetical protein